MNILFLSRWFPYPPDNGSKIRIFNLIKALSVHHQITLISFTSHTTSQAHIEQMRAYCCCVNPVPYQPFQPNSPKALLGFVSLQPRSVFDTYSVEMQTTIDQVVQKNRFDLVIATQNDMAIYAAALPKALPKILEELELTIFHERYAQETQLLKRLRQKLTWWKFARYLSLILSCSSGCTVVSGVEKKLVEEAFSTVVPIKIIPNGVDTTFNQPSLATPQPGSLIYTGALTYHANFDAVGFFLEQIYPLIQAQQSNISLAVTGSLSGVAVDTLPHRNNVTFTGYLDDIRPKIAESWVNVVPLRIGGGTRLKILESLALGTPVVTTSKGVEGLDLRPGQDIIVADTPAAFATAVVQVLREPDLRDSLKHNGRQAVEARYDWQMIGQQLDDFIQEVL